MNDLLDIFILLVALLYHERADGPSPLSHAQAQATQQMERAWQWTLNQIETWLGFLQRQRLEAAWTTMSLPS